MKISKYNRQSHKKEKSAQSVPDSCNEEKAYHLTNDPETSTKGNLTESNKIQSKLARVGFWSLIVNSLLAIGTFLVYWQATQQTRAAFISASAAVISANAADTSAANGKESNRLVREQFRVDGRPWVGVDVIVIDNSDIMKIKTAKYTLKNYGKTPAIDVSVKFIASWYHTARVNRIPIGKRLGDWDSKTVFAPTGWSETVIPIDSIINGNIRSQIQNNLAWLFIYGEISYTDIFGGSDTTKFCDVWDERTHGFQSYNKFNTMK